MDKKKVGAVALACLFVLLVIGLGANEASMWSNRIDQVEESVACPIVPSLNGVVAAKNYLHTWRWLYEDRNFGLKIETTCPDFLSYNGPARIFYEDELVGSSSCTHKGCIFYDCHRNPKYYFEWRTSLWVPMWSTVGISMAVYNISSDADIDIQKTFQNVVAVSTDTLFFGDNVTVSTVRNGSDVAMANMYRPSAISFDRKWVFSVFGSGVQTSAAQGPMDPLLLTLIAGRKAFSHSSDSEGTGCNSFFFNVAYAFIGFALTVIAGIVYAIYLYACQRK